MQSKSLNQEVSYIIVKVDFSFLFSGNHGTIINELKVELKTVNQIVHSIHFHGNCSL